MIRVPRKEFIPMTKFDDLKERFPNLIPVPELRASVSIIELAVHYGYQLLPRKGRTRPVLEHPGHGDRIIIKNPKDPAQQVYQRAGDFTDSGTIIDFIRNRLSTVFSAYNRPGEHEFRNTTHVLYDYLRIDPVQVNRNRQSLERVGELVAAKPFTEALVDVRPLEEENYLNRRHIAPETIQRPEFKGRIFSHVAYFDPRENRAIDYMTTKVHPERDYIQFTNVAFPYYNGKSTEVVGLELRNDKVKLHASGSDRINSVFISNPPPKVKRFHVLESAIDALSHRQLRSIGGDPIFDSVYFSTGGQLTKQQVETTFRYIGSLDKAKDWYLVLSFDRDPKGHLYDLQFVQRMIGDIFPMSPVTAQSGHVSYQLPEEERHYAIREGLLKKIAVFNDGGTLIEVNQTGGSVRISIPKSSAALAMVSNSLLTLTSLHDRVKIQKPRTKDFNEDLTQEVQLGKEFRYVIRDESGQVLHNGNSPREMADLMQNLREVGEGREETNKGYVLSERLPYGFLSPQVEIVIERGVVARATQTPEFSQRMKTEV